MTITLIGHLLPPLPFPSKQPTASATFSQLQIPNNIPNPKPILFSSLLSLALTLTLNSPLPSLAIPSVNPQPSPKLPLTTTPFTQSKFLELGLEDGSVFKPFYLSFTWFMLSQLMCMLHFISWVEMLFTLCRKIRPCPSSNPGCVSTNAKSSSFAFPWMIPDNSTQNAVQV